MQRLTAAGIRLGSAAAVTGAATYNHQQTRSTNVLSPRVTSDDDFEIVHVERNEVSAAVTELVTHLAPNSGGPLIQEVDEDASSDVSDSSSADLLFANAERQADIDVLSNVIYNVLNEPSVQQVVNDALLRDPYIRSRLAALPAAAEPLLLEGPPGVPRGDDLFDLVGRKLNEAFGAVKLFFHRLFRGQVSVHNMLTNEDGRPTVLLQITLAVAAIVLTKRMVRLPV